MKDLLKGLSKSSVRDNIAIFSLLLIFLFNFLILFVKIPFENKDMAVSVISNLNTVFTLIIGFYFGSMHQKKQFNEIPGTN